MRKLTPFVLALIPALYLATMARSTVFGDPTEYTYVAHTLGVAHPPGYAFITLIGKLYQTLIPFGTPAWRMHLVGVTAGTIAALSIYGIVRRLTHSQTAALVGAFLIATSANYWQHSIHANPHIITAAFIALYLYTLTRWGQIETGDRDRDRDRDRKNLSEPPRPPRLSGQTPPQNNKWLYTCCLAVGIGVTHHPLTVFAVPACALFIIITRPRILLQWKTILLCILCGLSGLLVWLYFPLRAPALLDTQFDRQMDTLNGFLDVVLARNLTGNLWAFGWSPTAQWQRWLVFWSLLRVQFTLPITLLAAVGLITLMRHNWRLFILYFGAWLGLYIFVINTVQDVMAYLLTPFLLVALFAALGLGHLIKISAPLRASAAALAHRRDMARYVPTMGLVAIALLAGPALQLFNHLPHISLRHFTTGQDYVQTVHDLFDGRTENATLLNDWEHLTQIDYARLVEGDSFDPAAVTPRLVIARPDYNPATDAPLWVDNVFRTLPGGPVFLTRFERSVFDAGFRVRARGTLHQVIEPGDSSIPPEITIVNTPGDGIDLVGYSLPQTAAQAGDYLPLVLALRVPTSTADIYMPVLTIGDIEYRFTTDSHLLTRDYLPGETIVEAFDFALPHNLPSGDYPASVTLFNLSQQTAATASTPIGTLRVTGKQRPPRTDHLLANFRQQIGLENATIKHTSSHTAPWQPFAVQQGDTLALTLRWNVIAVPTDSYTVFVHLIDYAEQNYDIGTLDGTPLGGAAPTYLWFPKWLPGQTYRDPYQFTIPALPPGQYRVEVGLYEQFTQRRLHIHDENGNVMGNDRFILGDMVINE